MFYDYAAKIYYCSPVNANRIKYPFENEKRMNLNTMAKKHKNLLK